MKSLVFIKDSKEAKMIKRFARAYEKDINKALKILFKEWPNVTNVKVEFVFPEDLGEITVRVSGKNKKKK